MMLRRSLASVPALLLAGSAAAQLRMPAKWYLVQVEQNAFTVEMPGVPDHRVVNDTTAGGTAFALHSYSLEAGGYSYVAQTALYPRDVDTTNPRRLLQAALDARAQALAAGKWTKVDWREILGGASAESVGTVRGGNALRQLVLLKEHRFASLAFLGPAGSVTGPEAERFFKSFKMA
jgi:acyl-coenzyme A thioesterase PaaI-like protein